MSMYQTIQAIWPYIGPSTRQVLSEWVSSPLTFAQVMMRYGGIERSQVVRELEACRVLQWVDGMPELVPFL